MVKILEAKVSQFFCRVEMPGEPWHCRARTTPTGELPAELAFFLQNVLQLHQQRCVILRVDRFSLSKTINKQDAVLIQTIEAGENFPVDFCTRNLWDWKW